eukprot:469870-Pelagomonas_calceolata.AAC.2
MDKDKRLMQLTRGIVPPVQASAMHRKPRKYQPRGRGHMRVTWMPSWEPEKKKRKPGLYSNSVCLT